MVHLNKNSQVSSANLNNAGNNVASQQNEGPKTNSVFGNNLVVKNETGQVLEIFSTRGSGKDKEIEEHKIYEYDENGRVSRVEVDKCGRFDGEWEDRSDGKIDTVYTYEYDENGRISKEEVDRGHPDDGYIKFGPDGIVDDVTTFEYDEQGRLIKETRVMDERLRAMANNPGVSVNGKITWVETHFFTQDGKVITAQDHDSDGVMEYISEPYSFDIKRHNPKTE